MTARTSLPMSAEIWQPEHPTPGWLQAERDSDLTVHLPLGQDLVVPMFFRRIPAGKFRMRLHDMHGNVWEWCVDLLNKNAYRKRPDGWKTVGWNEEDAERPYVLRGGSCANPALECRSAYRSRYGPDDRLRFNGFRLCVFPCPAIHGPEAKSEVEPAAAAAEPRDEAEQAHGAGVDLRQAIFSATKRPRKEPQK